MLTAIADQLKLFPKLYHTYAKKSIASKSIKLWTLPAQIRKYAKRDYLFSLAKKSNVASMVKRFLISILTFGSFRDFKASGDFL